MTVRLLSGLLAVTVLCSSLPWDGEATPRRDSADAGALGGEATDSRSAPVPIDDPCPEGPNCLCHVGGGFVPPEVHPGSAPPSPPGACTLVERAPEAPPCGVIERIYRPPRIA